MSDGYTRRRSSHATRDYRQRDGRHVPITGGDGDKVRMQANLQSQMMRRMQMQATGRASVAHPVKEAFESAHGVTADIVTDFREEITPTAEGVVTEASERVDEMVDVIEDASEDAVVATDASEVQAPHKSSVPSMSSAMQRQMMARMRGRGAKPKAKAQPTAETVPHEPQPQRPPADADGTQAMTGTEPQAHPSRQVQSPPQGYRHPQHPQQPQQPQPTQHQVTEEPRQQVSYQQQPYQQVPHQQPYQQAPAQNPYSVPVTTQPALAPVPDGQAIPPQSVTIPMGAPQPVVEEDEEYESIISRIIGHLLTFSMTLSMVLTPFAFLYVLQPDMMNKILEMPFQLLAPIALVYIVVMVFLGMRLAAIFGCGPLYRLMRKKPHSSKKRSS